MSNLQTYSFKLDLRWMLRGLTNGKATLVQVMARWRFLSYQNDNKFSYYELSMYEYK